MTRCSHNNCNKKPSYGNFSDGIKLTCVHHAKPEYVYLCGSKCTICKAPANYGMGSKKTWCLEHAQSGATRIFILCSMKGCPNKAKPSREHCEHHTMDIPKTLSYNRAENMLASFLYNKNIEYI